MAFAAGTHFGTYQVSGLIGVGGMGEVYRATDTTLGREVAIKVLPDSFAADADRAARFEREAKTLASLNHTNIGQIYGLERRDGTTALVMELVEGLTLAHRLMQGPIPVDEALTIALQIADALEAAHAVGIVHRDLKPANIKLRPDGTVKVLDFGIAKALSTRAISGPQPSPLTTPAMTEAGLVLGTAAYMSPEQARGKAVDQRADIWAFGCVLYEMLTGQPAFGGEDVTVTLARILERDTDLSAMPGALSPAVRHTIKLCLQKDVKKRIADIRDVKLALEGKFESTAATAHRVAAEPATLAKRLLPLAAMLVVGPLTAGLAVFALMQPAPPQVARFDVTAAGQTITSTSLSVAISPDGRSLAYLTGGVTARFNDTGADELRLRSLDSLESRVLVTQGLLVSPFFSPDGEEVGYYDNNAPRTLKRVSIQGGAASTIAPMDGNMRGASWGMDGSIIFATNIPTTGLWRVSALGGEPEALTTPAAGEGDHMFPEILPGGEVVLFTIAGATEDASTIAALSLESGEQTIVQRGGSFPRYSPTGHLLFGRAGVLWAVGFDAATLATRGSPVPVQEGVLTKGAGAATEISLAANGTLVYVAGSGDSARDRGLLFVAANGEEQVVLQSAGRVDAVGLSPDGTHAALSVLSQRGGTQADISILDLTRPGSSLPLARNGETNRNPIFSPDGRRIAWGSVRGGVGELLVQNADGSGQAETLAVFDASIIRVIPTSWWQDDAGMALVAVTLISNEGRRSIGVVTVGEPESFRPLGSAQFNQRDVAFSPDGRWVAYASEDKGFAEVYVERFPAGGGRQAVSIGGGRLPKWSEDGQALTYLTLVGGVQTSMERVTLSGGAGPDEPLIVAPAVELFPWRYLNSFDMSFDMSADGERFLVISAGPIGTTAEIPRTILVQNWAEELKRLVPTE